MIYDTDVLIWAQRGNSKAGNLINNEPERMISTQTYMELLQAATGKKQHKVIRDMLHTFNFTILPLSESISHRATVYIEHYALSHGIRAGDALIAATATQYNQPLCTANKKHYQIIPNLALKVLHP